MGKQLLACLMAITLYLTNGDVVRIERNWLVSIDRFHVYGGAYVQYNVEDEVHKIPMHNVLEIVETPYKGGQ